MNHAIKLAVAIPAPKDNVIEVNFRPEKTRRTTSLYTTDGRKKATAANPIRETSDLKKLQEHFLSKGQLRNYTILTVGVLFGLRAGDLLSLQVQHVLNEDGSFKTHCSLIESKTRKFNDPAITPAVQKLLAEYLVTRERIELTDPLFRSQKPNKDGNYFLDITSLDRILTKACKECGIPHISSHSFRKTFCYQMLKQHPNDDTVKLTLQQMLNHDSFKTTLTYCGLTRDAMDEYRAALEEVVM